MLKTSVEPFYIASLYFTLKSSTPETNQIIGAEDKYFTGWFAKKVWKFNMDWLIKIYKSWRITRVCVYIENSPQDAMQSWIGYA